MAVATGLTMEQLAEIRLASGLGPVDPDEAIFVADDIEALMVSVRSREMFGWQAMLALTRVLGSAVSRVTDAADAMFLSKIEMPMLSAGTTDQEFAAVVTRARGLGLGLADVMRMMLRQHLDDSINRHRAAITDHSAATPHTAFAVGFVDLVGFTSRSARLDSTELAVLVDRFESVAHDTITSNHGRLVKFIGDEVMFVAVDPTDGCTIARALLRRFGDDEQLTPRGGLAHGPVLSRGGDFFGPTVNLAARLTDSAVPGEVLVPADIARVAPSVELEPAGRRLLKGFADPVTVSSLSAG